MSQQKTSVTPFVQQASVLKGVLSGAQSVDEQRVSIIETIGVLTWLNQLQAHWAQGGTGIPEAINEKLFAHRSAYGPAPAQMPPPPAPTTFTMPGSVPLARDTTPAAQAIQPLPAGQLPAPVI